VTVVTRPVRRNQVLLGKMAELATLLTGYAGVVCAGEFAVVDWVTGLLPRTRWPLPVYLFAEGAAADSRPSRTIVLARRQRSARRLDFRTDWGGYLKPSLSTPQLTRASAAETCSRTTFT